jgi:hypothetical protein
MKTTLFLARLSDNGDNVVVSSTRTPTDPMVNITVRDLEIDCNAGLMPTASGYAAAVQLNGRGGMTITNVHALHAWGTKPAECFILSIDAYEDCVSTGNTIANCQVTDVVAHTNSYCSAIALNRAPEPSGYIEGTIVGNVVKLNCANGYEAPEFAYNSIRARNSTICNNESWWAARGFNNDTPWIGCMQFMSNTFHIAKSENSNIGMFLMNGMRYSKIAYNQFYIHGCNVSGIAVFGAETNDGSPFLGVSDLGIFNNVFYRCTVNDLNSTNDWTPTLSGTSFSNGIWMSLDEVAGYHAPHRIEIGNNWVESLLRDVIVYEIGGIKIGNFYNNTGNGFLSQSGAPWTYTDCPVELPPAKPEAVGDFDQDGHVDILLQAEDTTLKVWKIGLCDWRMPHFAAELPITPVPSPLNTWRICGTGDIGNDPSGAKNTDLFFQSDDGYVAWWTMDGTSCSDANRILQGGVPVNRGPGWSVIGAGDLDGDGVADLVLYHTSGMVGYWLLEWANNGLNLKTPGLMTPQYPGTGWIPSAVGDFNRDGWPDILFQDAAGTLVDSQLSIWYLGPNMTRVGDAAVVDPFWPGDVQWRVGAAGDYNDDNTTDILFQRNAAYGGEMDAWLMAGPNKMGAQTGSLLGKAACNSTNFTHPGCLTYSIGAFRVVGPR